MSLDDIKISSIFSPYPTTDFQTCPRYWDLGKRWEARELNSPLLAGGLIGSAVALGLEWHYKGGQDPYVAACNYVEQNYPEGIDRSLAGCHELARKGVRHGIKTDLGLAEILGVEKFYGRTRPDMVGRDRDGKLVVIDHKVKINLYDDRKEAELAKWDTHNQMFHYAWTVGQEMGEPVDRCVIHLIVLGPRVYTELHPIPMIEEHLEVWLRSVAKDWEEMKAIELGKFPARARFSACGRQYGCKFHDGCHVLYGDESRFEALYDCKERGY